MLHRTNRHGACIVVLVTLALACSDPGVGSQQEVTTELALQQLRNTLTALATDSHLAFGQEDATAYGVGWWGNADRSDTKSVCGAHPAVYGWDLGDIGNETNLDGVSFAHMQALIRQAYDRGGINTISWHMRNPVTGENAWDVSPALDAIVPGGSHHAEYQSKLDRVADFLSQCQGDAGELIPVVFRPFHEHTGDWFWWGEPHCTNSEYVALWVFTAEYLRGEKGLDNLLFTFSPWGSGIASESDYLFRYPGDDYVDVLGVDYYFGNSDQQLIAAAEIAVALAEARGKVAAITEFGVPGGLSTTNVDVEQWFTQDFLDPILASPEARRVAYAVTWRNAGTDHFFVPYPGHHAEADFQDFCASPFVLVQSDLPLPP